ncbi:MAG: hypothetical protein AAB368_03925, partial [bacterium]
LPVWMLAPAPAGPAPEPSAPAAGTLRIDEREYSGGVTLAYRGVSLSGFRARHDYADRYTSDDPRFARVPADVQEQIVAGARTSVSSTLRGFVVDETTWTAGWRASSALSLSLSYGRDRLRDETGETRLWTGEAAWSPRDWLEVRAGATAVRADGSSSRYLFLGATIIR